MLGDLAHQHADLPGYEISAGVTVLRALPVFSDRLALAGRCDIVERLPDGSLRPVEYKKGPRRRFANDDAQLCAQALCLEEVTGLSVPSGAFSMPPRAAAARWPLPPSCGKPLKRR